MAYQQPMLTFLFRWNKVSEAVATRQADRMFVASGDSQVFSPATQANYPSWQNAQEDGTNV